MKDWEILHKIDDETLQQLIALDEDAYTTKDIGSFSLCKKWMKINDEIYTVLKFKDTVVGYINFVALTDSAFEKFRKGQLKDYELTENDILPFTKGKILNCLLISVVIRKDFRDGEAVLRLTDGFTRFLKKLKSRGVKINKILQDCVSVDGVKYGINFFGAKFVCKSHRNRGLSKIYEINCSEPRKFYPPKLRYEVINKDNLKTAAQIQYQIFKDSRDVGYSEYKSNVEFREKFANEPFPIDFLVYYLDTPVGVVGLYEIQEYPDDVWVNWLGVLPEYRNCGIDTQILFHICKVAQQYNKKFIRIYTFSKVYPLGASIYPQIMQLSEKYRNPDDDLEWLEKKDCLIFTSSVVGDHPKLWNNKFADVKSERVIHKQSLALLKKDKIL